MELEDHRGLYRNVQGGDRRLGGDAAGPRLHGRTVARGRRAGGGPRALRRTVAGAGLRPGLCVRGLPRRATDDRPAGRGTDAQVVVRIHHPQGGRIEPAGADADPEPFAAGRGDRKARRGGLPSEQDRERRGQGAGRLGRRRDAGRRRVVDGAGPLRRYGRGSIGRGLAPLAGGAGTPLGGAVYQQGRLRQRRQRIRGIPPGRPPLYRRRKTRSWPKPTGGCETGYRW